jgi:pimeloyl-ACP methyl ester carboxylesterase
VELVQALGYQQCVLVGHDWGGALAFAMAIARPDMVRRLVILNAVHPWTFARALCHNPEQAAASEYMNMFRQPQASTTLLANDCAWLRSMLADATGKAPDWFDAATEARYLAAWSQPGAIEAGLNYYRASPLHPPTATDPGACAVKIDPQSVQVTMPTLVLWGERDRHLLPACLDGLEQVVPHLRVQRLPDASHWIAHEQPDAVNRMIRAFVEAAT